MRPGLIYPLLHDTHASYSYRVQLDAIPNFADEKTETEV